MESEKSSNAARIIKTKIKRSKTDAPPAHYVLKIKSFTQLSEIVGKTGDGKFESDQFETADYKWKLVVHPNGNEKTNGKGHISLYLASTDIKAISETSGGHINVLFSFFVYYQIQDNYLAIQDGEIKRYHALRSENGFDQLLPLAEFNNPSNGYLVDNCCVFGVEVKVIKKTFKGNELSFIKDLPNGTFTWKIEKISTLENKQYYESEVFSAGGSNWKLLLNPKGDREEKDRSISLYLRLDATNAALQSPVYVEYNLLVKDQVNGIHKEHKKVSHWFKNSTANGFGYSRFMRLKELHNASKGFIVNDTLIVEAKITLISVSQDLIS